MNILVTGCCGFIGYNFSKYLLANNKNNLVIGIDSIDNYYSQRLKRDRLKILKKNKNFVFFKFNLKNKKLLRKIYKDNKINIVFHFAAQAGVRFSFINPKKYLDSNILGFFNLLEVSKEFKIKKIIFSSSSSVYGDNKKLPLSESENYKEKNLYAITKTFNEKLSKVYSEKYSIKIIGLRFFTVYGEWGRPDMLMIKYINSSVKKKPFFLNNYGNHLRDFTYIKDVVKIIDRLSKVNFLKRYQVFNICSSKPIRLKKILKELNKYFAKPKIIEVERDFSDVLNTHGSNKRLLKVIGKFNFTDFKTGIFRLCRWYKDYYKLG